MLRIVSLLSAISPDEPELGQKAISRVAAAPRPDAQASCTAFR